jgi:adenylosuccinate synthase
MPTPQREPLRRLSRAERGGPNAAHKVYLASGEIFTHFSLPSGTQAGQARLALGPGAVVYPPELLSEIARCDVTSDRLSIDPHVMIIEDSDNAEEAELVGSIGSTASGTGVATARRLLRGENVRLARDVPELHPYIRPTHEILEQAYASRSRIMREGTQGSGLSLHHGPYPYVTSRDTNVAGCLAESGIAPARVRKVVMIVRSYPIRVGGNSGPLTTELTWDEIERRSGLTGLAEKERTSKTNRLRRVGEPEWDLLRRAALHNAALQPDYCYLDHHRPRRTHGANLAKRELSTGLAPSRGHEPCGKLQRHGVRTWRRRQNLAQ